ncbi:helix-turn-helix domain-containing protein [Silvibacterium sp.]|uniref:helix-turn-helix domain-containing protein n=1 Tax=Silvibacterium sp. TaxID=1964179 RepID=UPI0039E5EEE1
MSEFGTELRRERESRGIGLDTIAEATKISSRHLQALETNHFDQLPGGVFNKGIVRSYARVVGLDEEAWVERFMSAYRGSGQLKDDDANWIQFAENVSRGRTPEEADRPALRLRWAGVALLLAVLAVLGWFVWHYVSNKLSADAAPVQSTSSTMTVAALAFSAPVSR